MIDYSNDIIRINQLKSNSLIYNLLLHLKRKKQINQKIFDKISYRNGFRTRFYGTGNGKLALMGHSHCWLQPLQEKYGSIIEYNSLRKTYLINPWWEKLLAKSTI